MGFLFLAICFSFSFGSFTELDDLLKEGVADGVFPGAVGVVANSKGLLYLRAVGSFTYGQIPPRDSFNPPVSVSTNFDMASCSKVMATTTAAALLYQQGYFHIQDPVSQYLGPEYNANNKEAVRIVHLLTHDAGYPPDPVPGYWELSFACPETVAHPEHPAMVWTCNDRIYKSLLNQTLVTPPGQVYVYSDLSFITLHYVLGSIIYNQNVPTAPLLPVCSGFNVTSNPGAVYVCYFEAFVRRMFSKLLGMKNTGYLPNPSTWGALPPTRNDTWYRHAVSQGTVDDENAYALGGVSGHAGVFSNAYDIGLLMDAWLYGDKPELLNSSTIALWTREYNHSVSCRALGWSTNDQTVPDQGWDGTCGSLSSKTFLHIGYTGTQICADPVHQVYTVLLTNRVFPTGENIKIQEFRRKWNDKIAQLLGIASK